MDQYTYKVILKGKVVAEATSEREAHKEALRVGGVVGKSALRNPSSGAKQRAATHRPQLPNPNSLPAVSQQETKRMCSLLLETLQQTESKIDQTPELGKKLKLLIDCHGRSNQLYALGNQCGELYYTQEARKITDRCWRQIKKIISSFE
jgi:hypothetical protein